jgi:hypothetical protein
MNKSERLILLDIIEHSNIVPGIKNQMDTGAATSQRYDLMEQSYLTNLALRKLLAISVADVGEKEYLQEDLNESLAAMKEFKQIRTKENWDKGTEYVFTVRLGSW